MPVLTPHMQPPPQAADMPSPVSARIGGETPICVDLDGTVILTDSLHDSAAAAAFSNWATLWQLPGWLLRGRATLKRKLAERWQFDPALLPYNEDLIALLRAEKARGRRIVLATASDEIIAKKIAAHLGIFDEILASDGRTNLRGSRKADALCARFGAGQFAYAGNDAPDHAVWRRAGQALVVNASNSVRKAAGKQYSNAAFIGQRANPLPAFVRALRPYQWVKNLFVLVPLFTSGGIADLNAWLQSLAALAAFCAVASAIYLLNDLGDLAADRAHPRKRNRPFANGTLSVASGLAAAPVLALFGTGLGIWSGAWLALAIYAALSLAYTIRLKEAPLVDVFILAALYTLRLQGGGEASGHPVSLWLLGFSSFLFLSLALVKRVSELLRLQLSGTVKSAARRGYHVQDLQILQIFGVGATFASAVVLSLYVQSSSALEIYHRPSVLWGLIPLMLFWQCRLWLSTARGYMHDDPIVYAARDWVSWMVFASAAALMIFAGIRI